MAAANFVQALALLLVHEGGKTDDPHDPGGRTNWGITHFDYDAYRSGKGLPLRDVFLMDASERDDIYRTTYWNAVRGDDLPSGLDYVVFDGGVNSGNGQSIKWLQRAIPAMPANGRMSQALIGAVSQVDDTASLIEACCAARLEFLQNLSTFQYFGRGWTTRVNDVRATALAWATGTAAPAPTAVQSGSQPKALRESGSSLPSTAPGDVITAASGALLAATLALHVQSAAVVETPLPAPMSVVAQSTGATAPSTSPPTIAPTATPVSASPQLASSVATEPGPATKTASAISTNPAPPSSTPPNAAQAPATPSQTTNQSLPPPAGQAAGNATAATQNATNVQPVTAISASQPAPASAAPATSATAPLKLSTLPSAVPALQASANSAKPAPSAQAMKVSASTPVPSLHPAVFAKPVLMKSGEPAQSAVLPAHGFSVTQYGLAGGLLLGLFLSFSSRAVRARRLDALGDNPRPKTSLKTAKLIAKPGAATRPVQARRPSPPVPSSDLSIPIVRSIYARVLTGVWIFVTLVVNVIVLAKLLQSFGFAHEDWHQPFLWLGNLYDTYAGQAFSATQKALAVQFGFTLPAWVLPLFVLYVSMAAAFVAASSGLMQRDSTGESFFAAVLHAGWVFAVPSFVINAVRYRVVTRFARQNTALFFAYLSCFVVFYVGARFINDDILPGLIAKNEMLANPDAAVADAEKALNAFQPGEP